VPKEKKEKENGARAYPSTGLGAASGAPTATGRVTRSLSLIGRCVISSRGVRRPTQQMSRPQSLVEKVSDPRQPNLCPSDGQLESRVVKRGGEPVAVCLNDPIGPHNRSPAQADDVAHLVNEGIGFLAWKPETSALGQQVLAVGVAL
jgi:hypothetical protein